MTIVLACSRLWRADMAGSLSQRLGRSVLLVTSPDHLAAALVRSPDGPTFFPHWSHRIPPAIFERHECVVFHMTDVPFGRGGSPLQNLIARGIYETKISALRCTADLDAGPVYLKRSLSLEGAAEEIYIRAAAIIEDMIVEIVDRKPQPEPQSGEPVTFKRRKPEDGNVAQLGSLQELFDWIRMLDAQDYPPAFLEVGRFRMEFRRAARRVDRVEADVIIRMKD